MERRVGLVPGRPLVGRDLQAPRQRRRLAEQLLVEPVAPAADRLGDRDAGSQRVRHRRQLEPHPAAADPGAHPAEGDRPPDAEAALPHVERRHRVAAVTEVPRRVGDHVVQPAADQAERDRPDRDVGDLAADAAPGRPATLPHPDRDRDPEDDAQRVAADRQRAQVPDARLGLDSNSAVTVRAPCPRGSCRCRGQGRGARFPPSRRRGRAVGRRPRIWVPWVTS